MKFKGVIVAALIVWAGFCAVGLSMHRACRDAPVNHLGWVDVAGYDSEGYLGWYTNIGTMFSVMHRHPLMMAATSPITAVGSTVAQRVGVEAGRKSVIVMFALVGALNFLLLWIVMWKSGAGLLARISAAVLWMSFAHVWILGGIAESFSVSMLILLGTLLMVQCQVRDWRAWAAAGAVAGAVTITNVVKPVLAWLAGVDGDAAFRRMRRRTLLLGAAAGVGLVALGGVCVTLKWIYIDGHGVAKGAGFVWRELSECLPGDMTWGRRLWRLWNSLWCEPMALHEAVIGKGPVEAAYGSAVPHLACLGVLLLCAVSVVRNFRQPIVRALMAMLSVDFVIHVVCGWGIAEGQIYCGHWLFAVPILVALLPSSLALVAIPLASAAAYVNLSSVL